METIINLLGYAVTFVFAFGVMSEGVIRNKIRRFGVIAMILVLLVALIYSFIFKEMFIIGLFFDLIFVFLGSVLLLWILFKYVLKVTTYR